MDVNQQKAQAAQDCFTFNPMVNTVYVTSDLNCFANRNAAVNHARGLDEKEIDAFIRNDTAAVIDIDKTDDVTNESLTVPDARLAVVKATGGANGKSFSKSAASVAPVDEAKYVSARNQFSMLCQQWNAMTGEEQSSDSGQKLSAQLSDLHDLITKYEAANPNAITDIDVNSAPAADPAMTAPAADVSAAPAADVSAAPAADVSTAPAADVTNAAQPLDKSGVIDLLNHLVADAEHVLGLDQQKTV